MSVFRPRWFPYGQRRPFVPSAAAAISAVVAGALGSITGAITGTVETHASVNASIGEIGGAVTAEHGAPASAEITAALGPVTGTLTGTVESHAAVAGALAAISGTISATVESHASVAAALGAITGTVAGTVETHGQVAGQLGAITGAITGRKGAPLLRAHHSGRYLVDQGGRPFFVHGDTAWALFGNLDEADATQYLDDCAARGFNTIIVSFEEFAFSGDPPKNANGDLPFTGTAFQSSLTAAFWDFVELVADLAAVRGIVLAGNPAYIGINNTEGWRDALTAATGTQVQTAGSDIGARLKAHDNIIYHFFGDDGPAGTLLSRVQSLQAGVASADHRHTLYGTHYYPGTSGHEAGSPESWMTWDWIYKYGGYVHEAVIDGYNFSPTIPVILCEAHYENEGTEGQVPLNIRRQPWGAFLSGACGHFYGHGDIWGFGHGIFQDGTWQDALAATGRVQMGHLLSFVQERWWWGLAPDEADELVTAGRGTVGSAGYVVAGLAPGGAWAAAYIPSGSASTITVARSKLAGPITARWYNPRTGAYTAIGGSHPNTGTEQFTPPDTNDWVLALDAQGVAMVLDTIGEIGGAITASHGQSASIAGALGAITGTITGAVETHGAVAGALGAVTGTISATVETHASVAGQLGAITGAVTGTIETHAQVAGALAAISGTVTAAVESHAAVAGALEPIAGAIAAVHGATASAEVSAALGPITGTVLATVETHASVATVLGPITGAATATVESHAQVAGAIGDVTGSVTSTVEVLAQVDGALAPIGGAITASGAVAATGAIRGASLTLGARTSGASLTATSGITGADLD